MLKTSLRNKSIKLYLFQKLWLILIKCNLCIFVNNHRRNHASHYVISLRHMWHEQNIWEVVSYSEKGMVPSQPCRNSQRMKWHAKELDCSAPGPLLYIIIFSLLLLWNSWMCEQVDLLLLCFIYGSFPSVGLACSILMCSFCSILFCYKLLIILITR